MQPVETIGQVHTLWSTCRHQHRLHLVVKVCTHSFPKHRINPHAHRCIAHGYAPGWYVPYVPSSIIIHHHHHPPPQHRVAQFEMGARPAAARSFGPPCCTSYPDPTRFLRRTAHTPSQNTPPHHRRPKHKPPVPNCAQYPQNTPPPKDYVAINKQAIVAMPARRSSTSTPDYLFKKDFGRVPDYLVQRQEEIAQQAAGEATRARQQQQVCTRVWQLFHL